MADGARVEELRRRLEREPASRVFAQLAEELRKAGDAEGAARVARRGLAQHPGYTSARLTLARALLELKDTVSARVELETVLRAAPDNILAGRLLAECLISGGDLGSALLQLRAISRLSAGDRAVEAQIQLLEARLEQTGVGVEGPEKAARLAEAAQGAEPRRDAVEGEEGKDAPAFDGNGAPGGEIEPSSEMAGDDPGVEREASESAGMAHLGRGPSEAAWVSMGPAAGVLASGLPGEGSSQSWWSSGEGSESEAATPIGRQTGPLEEAERGGTEEGPSVSSATLAELYFLQGSPERAAEVYAELLRRDPANEKAKGRLREIQEALGPGEAEGSQDAGRLSKTIARLERLLEIVVAAREKELR